MINRIKKIYPLLCILLFVSSFLFLFRSKRFIADPEFLFMILPQVAIAKHISLFDIFWNSYSGCGVPFFPQPWSKFYLVLNIFFRLFDSKTAYVLFLIFGFISAYFALYYSAKYFYRDRYVSTFLALLYVSSGMLYGYFTINYLYIEYYIIMPVMLIALHKYIDEKNSAYLILLSLLSIYANLGVSIISIIMGQCILSLFIIFFVYEKYKKVSNIIYYLFLINIVTIGVNLFKIIPSVQYYFIEGVRSPSSYLTMRSFLDFLGPLNFLLLSGHYPINLHFLSLFLLLSYLFYSTNLIEKVSLKTFISFIFIIYTSYTILLLLNYDSIKTLPPIFKIVWAVHVPGTLMLGAGIRAFVVGNDRKKEWKALVIFGILSTIVYFLYAIKKLSFDIKILQNIKWPFIFAITFFSIIFISKNAQTKKLCAIIIILLFAIAFVHSGESYWATNNTYQETYSSKHNKEILDALGIRPSGNFTYNKISELYRIMGYKDKKLNIFRCVDNDVPFFSIANYPILFGVSTIHQHDNIFLKRYLTFIEILSISKKDILLSRLFPLLNIKYLFTYDNIDVKGFFLYRQLGDKKTKIYKNDNLLPRFFVVDNFVSYKSKEEFIKIINEGNADLTKTVLIEGYPSGKNKNTTALDYKIKNLLYKNDSISIDLDVNKSSFLILLDSYYPGWRVYINGTETLIYPAYLTFRTVPLPDAGSYKIEFKYYPTFFKKGIFIAMIVFMFLFLRLIYQRRKL